MGSNLRHNAKRDSNERELIDFMEALGATVVQLNGKDIPDLMIGFRGETILAEVKMPGKTLSEGQLAWHIGWQKRGGRCEVIRSIGDCEKLLNLDTDTDQLVIPNLTPGALKFREQD